jgi:hypothetical protein
MNTKKIKAKYQTIDLEIRRLKREQQGLLRQFARRADPNNPYSEEAVLLVLNNFGNTTTLEYLASQVIRNGEELGLFRARQQLQEILARSA